MKEMILAEGNKCSEDFFYLPSGFRDELELLLATEPSGKHQKSRDSAQKLLDLIVESMWQDDSPAMQKPARLAKSTDAPWVAIHFVGVFGQLEEDWADAESSALSCGQPQGCGWAGRQVPPECRLAASGPQLRQQDQQRFPDKVEIWDLSHFAPFSALLWLSYPVAHKERAAPRLSASPQATVDGAAAIKQISSLLRQALPWILHNLEEYEDRAFPMLACSQKLAAEAKEAARAVARGRLEAFDADGAAKRLTSEAAAWAVYADGSDGLDAGFLSRRGRAPIQEAHTHATQKLAEAAAQASRLASYAIVEVSMRIVRIHRVAGRPETLPIDMALSARERSAIAGAMAKISPDAALAPAARASLPKARRL